MIKILCHRPFTQTALQEFDCRLLWVTVMTALLKWSSATHAYPFVHWVKERFARQDLPLSHPWWFLQPPTCPSFSWRHLQEGLLHSFTRSRGEDAWPHILLLSFLGDRHNCRKFLKMRLQWHQVALVIADNMSFSFAAFLGWSPYYLSIVFILCFWIYGFDVQ